MITIYRTELILDAEEKETIQNLILNAIHDEKLKAEVDEEALSIYRTFNRILTDMREEWIFKN